MTKKELTNLVDNFSNKTVLLIGDGMIDAYMWGKVSRQSPEAPVPVVDVYSTEKRLGGATNVAVNLAALGAKTIYCGFVGNDENGQIFRDLLKKNNLTEAGLFTVANRPTTIKTRVIAHDKHVLRVDEETTEKLIDYTRFVAHIETVMQNNAVDVILFQDYNKGVLVPQVINRVVELAKQKNIPTIVDPKKEHFLSYQNVTLFKPNLKEIIEGLGVEFNANNAQERSKYVGVLKEKLNAEMILLTLSESGVYILHDQGESHLPAFKRNIVDVSGAGDTVVSVAALTLASGCAPKEIALLSNLAGGLVCEEVGVVPITKDHFLTEAIKLYA